MSKKLIRAVYYTRVSTNKEEQEQSFEAQEAYFKELLSKKNGYELIGGYCEKGVSGTKLSKRPEFNRMLEDAGLRKVINKDKPQEIRKKFISADYVLTDNESKFEMIFVKDSSRLARNTDIGIILKKLKDKGVYVYFCDLNRSNENPNDDIVLNMLFSLAQQESVDKSAKVRFGALQSAKNGKIRCGNQLYGYTYNKEENTLRIIKEEAKVVKKVFELRSKGNGARKICNYLNEKGIKTRKGVEFKQNVISRMLQNPTYTGRLVRNKFDCHMIGESGGQTQKDKSEWIIEDSDKVDRIIDDETFNKVQELINANISKNNGISKGQYKGRTELAQKIVCEKCQKYYTRNTDKLADGSKKIFYNCATKKSKGKNFCDSRNVSSEEIEHMINFFIQKGQYKKTTKNFLNIIIERQELKKASLYTNKSDTKEIEDIKKQIEDYKVQLNKLVDIFLGDNSNSAKEVFNSKKELIENDMKKLENRLGELTLSDREIEKKENEINHDIKALQKYCEEVPEDITREEFIRDHLISFVVKDDGKVYIFTKTHKLYVKLSKFLRHVGRENK